jgi:HEAT repeat protein
VGAHGSDAAIRRRDVAIAGHRGDVAVARAGLADTDASVRQVALGALERLGMLTGDDLRSALADADVAVRRRAVMVAAGHRDIDLVAMLHDVDARIVEVAAWACGEHETVTEAVVERLIELGTDADEPLVRESAVAALGAIGDRRGLHVIVAATADKPAVRRRAVLALAPFLDDDEFGELVDSTIDRALEDRDWQVRQAAEDLRRITGTDSDDD